MLFVPAKPQEPRLSHILHITPTPWSHGQIKIMMKMRITILQSTFQEQVLVIPVWGAGGWNRNQIKEKKRQENRRM